MWLLFAFLALLHRMHWLLDVLAGFRRVTAALEVRNSDPEINMAEILMTKAFHLICALTTDFRLNSKISGRVIKNLTRVSD